MPRNKYPEQTVEKILSAAERLFAQKGYAKTTLQDIIDTTGLSKGAVYHHFKSKEEIAARWATASVRALPPSWRASGTMLLGTLAGGVLADRCRKQKIMAVLDTVSAIGMAAAAVILPAAPVTPLVLAALCLLYAVEGLYQPAVQASLPLLLDGAALARGNAVIQLVDTIDELLGPLLGSVLLHS